MDALIRELQSLSQNPQVSNAKVVGAVLASVVKMKDVLDARRVGIEAFATAVAMQPVIDPATLHEDFMAILAAHFESARHIPAELKDVASAVKLASADRRR